MDQLVSHGTDLEGLDDERAARSVLVHGIPAQARDEDIVIHFQKVKNGGGEIDHVRIAGDGKAVITFESYEVAQSVLGRPHLLKGSKLELTSYRLISKKLPEVFERVTARVNLMAYQLSARESQQLLRRAQQETNVAWHEACDGFILSGTFDQVEKCRQLLPSLIARSVRSQLQLAQERRDDALDRGESQQHASERCEEGNENFNHPNISTFDVQPQFMKLLRRAYEKELQEIENNFSIMIVWEKDATKVEIRSNQISGTEHFQDGCDAFINLYQKIFPEMKRELVVIDDCRDDAEVQKLINAAMAENPVLIERNDRKLSIYGPKSVMNQAIDDLKRGLRISKARSQNSRRDNSSKLDSPTAPTDGFDFPQHNLSSPSKALSHELCNGVMISLQQGDITDQRVDAIVNAANEWLQHGGGVAGAIVAKGGRQINQESRQLMSRRKKLEVGEAVWTRGGHLASKHVIHAVGPRWEEHGRDGSMVLLRRACVESLRLAGRLNLSSVALPAISSGIFGMPKDVCAKVMFDAVDEYSISVDVQCSNLRDVRFVIIDAPTFGFFHEEFIKRYLSQDSLQMRSNRSEQFADEKLTTQSADTHGDQQEPSNTSPFAGTKNMGSTNQGKEVAGKKVPDQTAVSHKDHQQCSSASPLGENKNTIESDDRSPKAITGKDNEESKATYPSTHQAGRTADNFKEVESRNIKNNGHSSTKTQDAMPNSEKGHQDVAGGIGSAQHNNVADSITASCENVKINAERPSQGDGLAHGNSDQTREVETPKGPLLNSITERSAENVTTSGKVSQDHGLAHGNSDRTGNVVAPKGSIGRGRGALAVCFLPKTNENERYGSIANESNRSVPIAVARNITAGRGRGLTTRNGGSFKNPPGLRVTSEGLDLAKNLEDQRDSGRMSPEKEVTSKGQNFPKNLEEQRDRRRMSPEKEVTSKGQHFPKNLEEQRDSGRMSPEKEVTSKGQHFPKNLEEQRDSGRMSPEKEVTSKGQNFPKNLEEQRDRRRMSPVEEVTPEGRQFPAKNLERQGDPGEMSFQEGSSSSTVTVAVLGNDCISNGLRTEISKTNTGGEPTTENKELAQFPKDQQNGSLLQTDRDQIYASGVPRSNDDHSCLKGNAPKGETPVTNVKNAEPEHSNEDRSDCDRGAVEGQKPSSMPNSVHGVPTGTGVSSSDPKTRTENTTTRGTTTGDKREVSESVRDSSAPNNGSVENNANTIEHYNTEQSQDSARGDDGKLSQPLVSEDDTPEHQKKALAVPGILHKEHEEKSGKETSCQQETNGLSNPSCDKIVAHAHIKRSIKDESFYGGKFQKLECNAEKSQSPGSFDHSLICDDKASESLVNHSFIGDNKASESLVNHSFVGDDKASESLVNHSFTGSEKTSESLVNHSFIGDDKTSESLVASSNIEAPVKSEGKHDTQMTKTSTNEETNGNFLQNSDQSSLNQEENEPALKATKEGTDFADGYNNFMLTSGTSEDPAPPPRFQEVVQPSNRTSKSEYSIYLRPFNNLSSKDYTHNGVVAGSQPHGYMTWRTESRSSLPGYDDYPTIVINYNIVGGVQGSKHPNPGKPFQGLFCTAYLPENAEGVKVLELLTRAFEFDAGLLFTVGTCPLTGVENIVLWNGIELKTSPSGGPANFGYPDPSYLDRVRTQLAEKGFT